MHRYLTEPIVSYFMNNEDPFVKYLFLNSFPGFSKTNERPDYLNLKKYKFLNKKIKSGVLTDLKKWNRSETGSLWNLYIFISLGYNYKDNFVSNTISYLNSNYLSESGYFSFGWNPEAASSLWTGEYLNLLLDSGYQGEELEKIVKWIVMNQNPDGGWFTSPIQNILDTIKFISTKKIDPSKSAKKDFKSCVFSTISCMRALIKYSEMKNVLYEKQINNGAEFLLNEKTVFSEVLKSRDGFIVNNNFQSVGTSIFGQIDIIKFCRVMSKTKYKDHGFVIPAVNYLIKQKRIDEGWSFSAVSLYFLEKVFDIRRNRGIDPFATIEILKLLEEYN